MRFRSRPEAAVTTNFIARRIDNGKFDLVLLSKIGKYLNSNIKFKLFRANVLSASIWE